KPNIHMETGLNMGRSDKVPQFPERGLARLFTKHHYKADFNSCLRRLDAIYTFNIADDRTTNPMAYLVANLSLIDSTLVLRSTQKTLTCLVTQKLFYL
ncbi:hypothetical protein J6590_075444, partial [Homalodisca vitripennis]